MLISLDVVHAGNKTGPQRQDYGEQVNLFIGTAGEGNTTPAATLPFGMVQLGPDTRTTVPSGYRFGDSTLLGFSHTHLSGTGCGDYGDILFVPMTGRLRVVPGDDAHPGYRFRILKQKERASPGYYSVTLKDADIRAELTATLRAGFHRYTFPKSDSARLLIDLSHGIGVVHVDGAGVRFVSSTEIQGWRTVSAWAENRTIYFYAKFSKPFAAVGVALADSVHPGLSEAMGVHVKAYATFNTGRDETVLVKVGISAVSVEGAKENLTTEIPDWDFERVRREARDAWNTALAKIQVDGGTEQERTTFYTALYHALLAPNLFMDVDRKYRGMDGKVHEASDFTNYSVFSLWDTFRAVHPLLTILDPDRTADFVQSLVKKYEEAGTLPVWELSGFDTGTMIGYHAVSVIADAFIKGIRKFNIPKAYEAVKQSAERNRLGLRFYKNIGFVPADRELQSVSKTLEYAYDDWCVGQMAGLLGDSSAYRRYNRRAQFYVNVFDSSTGFMRARRFDRTWVSPFSPDSTDPAIYTEANAWQYEFFVPQDVTGLMDLYGGSTEFIARLDSLFAAPAGSSQFCSTGMIGQYAQGNEPCHHVAYLYSYAGAPWRTQEIVRRIMDSVYTALPDGLPGNDDAGQMSAWYVFSAMGFYPVCPGQDTYVIGTPLFPRISIDVGDGKRCVIRADGASKRNKYVTAVTRDGRQYFRSYLRHDDIMSGGEYTFTMNSWANKGWGHDVTESPASSVERAVAIPFSIGDMTLFADTAVIALSSATRGVDIHYTLDGSEPTDTSTAYTGPFELQRSVTIKARAFKTPLSPSAPLTIDAVRGRVFEAQHPVNLVPGLHYEYFEGLTASVNGIPKLALRREGTVRTFTFDPREHDDAFAFRYSGYFNVPRDGKYTFYLVSDDGSRLSIDDTTVVDNDGSHSDRLAAGKILLKAGMHSLTVLYFDASEGEHLDVSAEGPGVARQPLPAASLYHRQAAQ